jgi:DUF4097 and DUF4098 domain-containing protein YvlB
MNRAATRTRIGLALAILSLSGTALAETRIAKTLKLAPGGEFRLETDMGKVTLTGSSDADAHVVVTSRRKDLDELLSFRWDESDGLVSIIARKKHKFDWFSSSGDNVQYEIRVPAQTRVSVETSGGGINISGIQGTVLANTSGGGIGITDVVGDVDVDTSGGGISLKNIKGRVSADTSGGGVEAVGIEGPVRAESSGGSIELERVTGDIDADTSGGGIRIVEAGGRVKADTSGGGIEASFAKGNSMGGSLETSGGGIKVMLDPDSDLAIEASGTGVKTDLPLAVRGEISRGSLSGTLGKGGNTLRLHTSGGSVRIQSL